MAEKLFKCSKEEIKMINKIFTKMLNIPIWEISTKSILRFHLTPVRMIVTRTTNDN